MSDRDSEFGAFLTGFVVGGLVGAAVSLLFAPQSGEETRAIIKEKSIELKDKAVETVEEAYSRAEAAAKEAKARADEFARIAQERADELMKRGHIELSKAAVTAIAIVTPAVKKGVMYANMLDMKQPSNSLAARVVDNITGNYRYKMGVAMVRKMGESQYKKEFRSMSFAPRNIT